MRQWQVQMSAPFGVVAMICYGDDDRLGTAKTQWLLIAKGVVIPER